MSIDSKSLDILVGGDLFIDLIMSGFASWPQPGTEAFAQELHREVGGGVRTVSYTHLTLPTTPYV